MDEMQHAEPGARGRFLTRVATAALAGALFLAILQAAQPAVMRWIVAEPGASRARAQLVLGVLGALVLAPLAGAAIYTWRLGLRARREARFPPTGVLLIRDVRVLRGDLARRRGRTLQAVGFVLLGIVAALAVLLVRLATLRAAG